MDAKITVRGRVQRASGAGKARQGCCSVRRSGKRVNAGSRACILATALTVGLSTGCGSSRADADANQYSAITAAAAVADTVPRPVYAARMVAPGDLLSITVLDAPEFTREMRVAADGKISLPLLGVVPAAGQTPRDLETSLADRLRGSYMVDPQVTVDVVEAAEEPVYVVGQVNRPGAFVPSGTNRLTVLQALALAEGAKPTGAQGGAVVIRTGVDGSRTQIPVHIPDVVKGEAPDLVLQPNDIVYVPTAMGRSVALGIVDTLVRVVTFRAVF
jgi:polysaccharide export outer membrane protein